MGTGCHPIRESTPRGRGRQAQSSRIATSRKLEQRSSPFRKPKRLWGVRESGGTYSLGFANRVEPISYFRGTPPAGKGRTSTVFGSRPSRLCTSLLYPAGSLSLKRSGDVAPSAWSRRSRRRRPPGDPGPGASRWESRPSGDNIPTTVPNAPSAPLLRWSMPPAPGSGGRSGTVTPGSSQPSILNANRILIRQQRSRQGRDR